MKTVDEGAAVKQPGSQAERGQLARQAAIKQIELRRRFRLSTAASAIAMAMLVAIWERYAGRPSNG
jgi:hypothetical protein